MRDVKSAQSRQPSSRLLFIQRQLHAAALGENITIGAWTVPGIEYADVVYQLVKLISMDRNRSEVIDVMRRKRKLKGIQIPHFDLQDRLKTFESFPLSEREIIIILVSVLLDFWPREFVRAFSQTSLSASRITRDMRGPPWWFSKIVDENFSRYESYPNFERRWERNMQ